MSGIKPLNCMNIAIDSIVNEEPHAYNEYKIYFFLSATFFEPRTPLQKKNNFLIIMIIILQTNIMRLKP